MQSAYRTHFEALDAATEELLTAVAALPHPGVQPADGGWSGVQVVRHLLGTETSITALLEKQATKPAAELPRPSLRSWLRARLMSFLLARPGRRFKSPARFSAPAAHPIDVDRLRGEWTHLRQRLGRLLSSFPTSHRRRAVFQHPRAGWLTLNQTLRFMTDHVRHHQQQVARLAEMKDVVTEQLSH